MSGVYSNPCRNVTSPLSEGAALSAGAASACTAVPRWDCTYAAKAWVAAFLTASMSLMYASAWKPGWRTALTNALTARVMAATRRVMMPRAPSGFCAATSSNTACQKSASWNRLPTRSLVSSSMSAPSPYSCSNCAIAPSPISRSTTACRAA